MTRGWREPFEDCYKVSKSGCWLWQRGMTKNGYGLKQYRGKFNGAHRVSWMIHRGEIPSGLSVLHRCDVKHCVNPGHLFLGTQKDNLLDMAKKGRSTSRFTAVDVQTMREMRMAGKTLAAIGSVFGVGRTTIHHIVTGRTWRHVA